MIGYPLVITVLATRGRLGDMFGRVRMYEAGFLIFVLGSLARARDLSAAEVLLLKNASRPYVPPGQAVRP